MRRFIYWSGLALIVAAAAAAPARAGGFGGCPQNIDAPGEGIVTVADYCFLPGTVFVHTGETVRWQLQATAPHSVTFTGEDVDSGNLSGDFAVRFNQPGTYEYFCSIHPAMTGSVDVSGETLAGLALESVEPAGSDTPSTSRSVSLDDSVPMRVELSPITALTIIAVMFPLTLAAAMRLVDARPRSRIRLRVPWERDAKPEAKQRR